MRSDRSSTKETDGLSRPVKHALPAAAELPAVSRTTGIARSTIGRGLADLRSGTVRCSERVRRGVADRTRDRDAARDLGSFE